MTDSEWLWLCVAVAVFWAVGAYRRLMGLRAQVNKLHREVARLRQRLNQLPPADEGAA